MLYPTKRIVPTLTIDEFWHAHILDTRAYMADCKALFGKYMHHYPYSGLKGRVRHADGSGDTGRKPCPIQATLRYGPV